jgi:hypothetical protein
MTSPTNAGTPPPTLADMGEMQDSAQEIRRIAGVVDMALKATQAALALVPGATPGYSLGPAAAAAGVDLNHMSRQLATYADGHSTRMQQAALGYETTAREGQQSIASIAQRLG